jgi:ribosomal protein L5
MNNYHYNSITKFQFQGSLEKCKFNNAVIDTSLNSLIVNSKLLLPLFYLNLNIIGQRPVIKETKKSIANFKVRPNIPMGTLTSMSAKSLEFVSFMDQIKYSFMPSISRQNEGMSVEVCVLGGSSKKGLCGINIGVADLTYLYSFFLLPSAFFNSTNLGGCNFSFVCSLRGGFGSNVPLSVYNFFYSQNGFPIK